MQTKKCPVCETIIEIPENFHNAQRVTCPNCFAQLALYHHKGVAVLGCAICKESIFNPENCENCEQRREKKRLLEEGRL
jgi:hypothetical protein